MKTLSLGLKPSLLTDPTAAQLKEIYTLRAASWATNPLFDTSRFPDGISDAYDKQSFHWIVNYKDRFVAVARLTIGNQPNEWPDHNVFNHIQPPIVTSMAMLTRLVVHPDFRGLGLSRMMDAQRIDFLESRNIPITIAYAAPQRAAQLIKTGFCIIGLPNVQHMRLTGNEGEQVLSRQAV